MYNILPFEVLTRHLDKIRVLRVTKSDHWGNKQGKKMDAFTKQIDVIRFRFYIRLRFRAISTWRPGRPFKHDVTTHGIVGCRHDYAEKKWVMYSRATPLTSTQKWENVILHIKLKFRPINAAWGKHKICKGSSRCKTAGVLHCSHDVCAAGVYVCATMHVVWWSFKNTLWAVSVSRAVHCQQSCEQNVLSSIVGPRP